MTAEARAALLALVDSQVTDGAEVSVDVRGRREVFLLTKPPFVTPGAHAVRVELQGFRPVTIERVNVQLGERVSLPAITLTSTPRRESSSSAAPVSTSGPSSERGGSSVCRGLLIPRTVCRRSRGSSRLDQSSGSARIRPSASR